METAKAKITVEWLDNSGRTYTVHVSSQRSVDRTIDFLTELIKEPLKNEFSAGGAYPAANRKEG